MSEDRGTLLAKKMPSLYRQGGVISADGLDSIARLAVSLSLLASYKVGRGGGWHRARRRAARAVASGQQKQRDSRGCTSSPTPGPMRGQKRHRLRIDMLIVGLWIALSLLLVGYATVRGEVAFAELDDFDLLTVYSSGPVAPLLDGTP